MESKKDNKDLYDRFYSSLLAKTLFAVIAIIGFIVTVYTAFFQEKVIRIQYVVIGNSNVLDINTEVSKVDILYDSTSLKKSKKNLRIYNIKVVNNGDADVLKTFFDENEPLGILIENGEIAEKPEITETSSSYIKRNLKTFQKKKNHIEFSRIILESEEHFTLKILVLHNNSVPPKLTPIGKVAGQKHIRLINASEVKVERPFLIEAFSGSLWVQLVRVIAYFILIVFIVIVILFLSETLGTLRKNRERKKNIRDFKNKNDYTHNKMNNAIFSRYDNDGGIEFSQMRLLIRNEIILNKTYKEAIENVKEENEIISPEEYLVTKSFRINDELSVINFMIHDGLVFKEGDKLIINQPMKACLIMFIDFLIKRGQFIGSRNSYPIYRNTISESNAEEEK